MMEWMIDTFWATSLLILAVILLRKPIAQYFGASIAYTLWLIPAARLLMPTIEKEVVVPNDPINIIIPQTNITSNIVDSTATTITSQSTHIDWVFIAVILWISIAGATFIIQTARYMMMRDEILANAHHYGQIGNVIVIESDIVSGPLAFGIFKKYIVVPQDFEKLFPIGERDLAIAHEMAHHKSGDLIANLCAFIFLCLTWFSPLSWYAWTKFRLDQESACDARVLKNANNKAKQIYGRALTRGAANDSPIFLAAMSNPKTIITRLRKLKMPPISKSRSLFGKISIATIIAITLPFTATVHTVAAQDREVDVKEIDIQDNEIISENKTQKVDEASTAQKVRIIKIKNKDDKKIRTVKISPNSTENHDIQTIEKEGKVFHISSDGELSQDKIDKIIADTEKSISTINFTTADNIDSGSTRFIIKTDNDGEVKTFDVLGDASDNTYAKTVIFENKSEAPINIDDFEDAKFSLKINFDNHIMDCINADNNDEKCENIDVIVNKEIDRFKKEDLSRLKNNMRKNIIPAIKASLKNTELSKKECKEIIKELSEEVEKLDIRFTET